MGTSFVGNLAKKLLPVCFFSVGDSVVANKSVLATSTRFKASVSKRSILEVTRFVKIQTFRQLEKKLRISDLFYLTLVNV